MCTRRPIIFILSLGIVVNTIKVAWSIEKKNEYYNIIQNNEMIIAFINNEYVSDRIFISLIYLIWARKSGD